MKRLLPLLLLVAWSGCGKSPQTGPVEDTRFLMDTAVRIAVYEAPLSQAQIESAIQGAFEAMQDVERKTSAHQSESDVARLNRCAGGEAVPVSEETRAVLHEAVHVSAVTNGAFDPTIAPIQELWGFFSGSPTVPEDSEIRSRLPLVDYSRIEWIGNKVRLGEPGVGLDLGGIAKGFNIDRAVEALRSAGVRSALVDAGGDLRIFGPHPKNPHWRIGIKHPRRGRGSLFGVIETGPVSIATSGDYERFFIREGRRYHHILDPKTGRPARGCISVTVVTDNAVQADAYATAVFVMGPDKGMALIESRPDLEGVILYKEDGEIRTRISSGLKNKVQLL